MGRKRNNKPSSLAHQLRSSVNNNFEPGKSKRAAKLSDDGFGAKVYGYSSRDRLLDVGTQFANYCRDNFSVKFAKDIEPRHVQAFLKSKADAGVQDSTLKSYYQSIKKLNLTANATFCSSKGDWTKGVSIPCGRSSSTLRSVKMSREGMDKVLDKLDMRHASHRAIACAEALGLRASEAVRIQGRHIDLNRGVVGVVGKGGRYREIPIREDRRELLTSLKEQYSDCRIANVKADSVNATLKRICQREDISDLDGSKSGIHAVRKLYATEQFEDKLESGMDERQAWGDVSEALGHGRDRTDLYKVYIVRD